MSIFISYAREDAGTAKAIYDLLRSNRFRPWLDSEDIQPGANWKIAIRKAIQECDVFLACLSAASIKKRGYMQAELKEALEVLRTVPEDRTFLIPVRLNECEVPFSLREIQRVDFFSPDGPQRLLQGLRLCVPPEGGRMSPFRVTLRPPGGSQVPTIAVEMASMGGTFTHIVGKMDTGAAMTALTFDAARALGIPDPRVGACGVIRLASATGHSMECFRHNVMIRLAADDGAIVTFVLLVAFAESIRSNLFGMDWIPHLAVTVDREGVHLSRPA